MMREKMNIYKIAMEKIIAHGNKIQNYTEEEAMRNGELVPISSSQLTRKIQDYFKENGFDDLEVRDVIVNIVVPSASGRQADKVAKAYSSFAHSGFYLNERHYVRLMAGSGQLRQNTITYVWDYMRDYLMESLCCGIKPEDLGESFSVSKWNAYVGLSESGMNFLESAPRVCVISDYEKIKPHFPVDFIETVYEKRKRVWKKTTRYDYDDPEIDFAPLNSFDGQGLADPAWVKKVALELGYLQANGHGYVPSEYILRAPWCKGLVVNFDFKKYFMENGVTKITDVYGQEYDVENIDILLSTSQFKMWKAYKKYGGWKYHEESMKKYKLKWGVVFANKEKDDDYRALNYQYIQALDLSDEDITNLCGRTERLLTDLCSGDIETVYRTLVGFSNGADDIDNESETPSASLLQRAVAHNYELLQDTYIRELIYREAESKFNNAKIGKIMCRGGYGFIVSDPVAQIQHIIQAHAVDGNRKIKVTGLIPAKSIYSNYWNHAAMDNDEVVLMRSPLVDASEVTVCKLVDSPEMDKWFANIRSGLVLSIYDLNTLALQNCDFDGDRAFCSNDEILIRGAQKNPVPILYPSAGAALKGAITPESIIDADTRGLNSAVGSLSNLATCLYALRDNFQKGSEEYEELSRRIKVISELVGVEIDKIKTGIPPAKPSAWSKERIPNEQFQDEDGEMKKISVCSPEEQERICKHNSLIPDCKPYFMRYIYDAMDRDIIKYDKAFDSVNKFNNGKSLKALLAADYDTLNDDERWTVDRYYKYLPAIDSPCNMNKICKRFEQLQKQLKKNKNTRNMLLEFATPQDLDDDVIEEISKTIDLFQRQKRFITKTNNTSKTSNKQIAKETRERFDLLHTYIRKNILELVNGDIQSAYNYMTELSRQDRCAESTVWAILDDSILKVIKKKKL